MMLKRLISLGCIIIISNILLQNIYAAENIYFEQDFDNKPFEIGVSYPLWSLSSSVNESIGKGNFFNVVSNVSHSGASSLQFDYDGRNGICNMCGSSSLRVDSSLNNSAFYVDSARQDLSLSPINAAPGRFVYNKSNGFSKWKILSLDNQFAIRDKLTVSMTNGNISGTVNGFSAGDDVLVFRQCGIDGTIGTNIDRRSDCNVVISYFDPVTQSSGSAIFRRVYIMVPSSTVLPYNQKIRYWDTTNGPIHLAMRSDAVNDVYLFVGANIVGGPGFTRPSINIQRDTWYYIEEEFKSESSTGAADGEYTLWFAKAGSEIIDPVVHLKGLNLGNVVKTSLWGNEQHGFDSHGVIYIDDIRISSTRNGPVVGVNRPNPPNILNVN